LVGQWEVLSKPVLLIPQRFCSRRYGGRKPNDHS